MVFIMGDAGIEENEVVVERFHQFGIDSTECSLEKKTKLLVSFSIWDSSS
ncbi:hypothetical protein Hanom_Chr08g00756781 [Helianthus anomalus]